VEIQRRNLSEAVVEELLGWLGEGKYRPGDKLPTERALMDQFGVGRNTVREAIQALVALGAVSVRPGTGTTVLATQPSAVLGPEVLAALFQDTTLDDLYEFRRTLETDVAFKAAERATADDIQRAEAALAAYDQRLADGQPVYQADIDFHRALAVATHNAIYVKMSDALLELIIPARKATDQVPEATLRAVTQHRHILDAVINRDPDAARMHMQEHIESAIWALNTARRQVEAGVRGSRGPAAAQTRTQDEEHAATPA
jgi:GntR family transcriptional repressor for pyruvate dehydrogenase complex